jgi:hypothetical protein
LILQSDLVSLYADHMLEALLDTLIRIIALLLFYTALFVVIRITRHRLDISERRIYRLLYLGWAAPVFVANYLLARVGLESPMPWYVNFLHTFGWIGLCLGWLYLGTRREPRWVQFVAFAIFSLVVKLFEQKLFGAWTSDHFFFVFGGNWAHVLGWSLADGLYPLISAAGLELIERLRAKATVGTIFTGR